MHDACQNAHAMPIDPRLGLSATEDPTRFTLHVHEGITTAGGALQGGAALGAAVTAMARVTERPLVWATGHFLRHGAPDTRLALEVEVGVAGHKVSQAQSRLVHEGQTVMSVVGAFGSRDIGGDFTFAERPQTPPPEQCPIRSNFQFSDWEARCALGRTVEELDGKPGTGRSATWYRRPDASLPVTAGELSIISDCSAIEVSDAVGFLSVNASLDNTLRMAIPADARIETDWILLDARVAGIANGFAMVNAELWSEDGTLLCVFSQSLVVRRGDAAGQALRTTKRYAGSRGD